MAKIERGSFTPSGTPPFTATVLFNDPTILADEITLFVGPAGSSDSTAHIGDGFMTPTQQQARALLYANSVLGGKSELSNTKCLIHYTNTGSITKVAEGTRNSMSTTGRFSIDWTTWTGGYPIYFIARQY